MRLSKTDAENLPPQGEQDRFPPSPPSVPLAPGRAGGGAIVFVHRMTGERRLVLHGSAEHEALKREIDVSGRALWEQDGTPGATSA